jgi:xanthine/CO dehydrogenase XdhC/CoxF family maturation factor
VSELRPILVEARRLGRERRPFVLATVVRTAGSTYRKPGARMLIPPEGDPVGLLSGGCLETDLVERAGEVLASGRPSTLVYDMRSPDDVVWGLGLGCDGEVRVLLERHDGGAPAWLEWLAARAADRQRAALATVFEAGGAWHAELGRRGWSAAAGTGGLGATCEIAASLLRGAVERALEETLAARRSSIRHVAASDRSASAEVLLEHLPPPPGLVVFGAGEDARPLVALAARLGWTVTVADHRPALVTARRFPEADALVPLDYDDLARTAPPIDETTPVVIMTHHFLHDLALLGHLSRCASVPYVGLLGPRRRARRLLERSGPLDLPLYGPVGIDIGASTPAEIALAILAEAQAILAGRRGGHLRDRTAALHEWPP